MWIAWIQALSTDLPNLDKLLSGWDITPKDDLVIDTNLMAQLAAQGIHRPPPPEIPFACKR